MSWTRKAALAAAALACASGYMSAAKAQTAETRNGQWLKDGSCSLFSADAHFGDSVSWTGDCMHGKASGLGTATFTGADGKAQSFTADFVEGVVPDGYVATRWGQGWSYEGEAKGGVFQGAGILTTDANDRFEGQWLDGKMNGFGVLRRANGERYAGDWKNDKPNGTGELRHADGTLVKGVFVDGKLEQASMPVADKADKKPDAPALTQAVEKSKPAPASAQPEAPFSTVSGKMLTGVDGSTIALNPIEGGMEMQLIPGGSDRGSNARKTTFTYMTDRMGTVVEDSSAPGAGTSVTGFFRLTAKGIEVRYADGRSAMLSATSNASDGGVQMALDSETGKSCQAWYPAGHNFSDAEKRAALNAYAGKLGLAMSAANSGSGCTTPLARLEPQTSPGTTKPSAMAPGAATTKFKKAASHGEVKAPAAHLSKTAYHIGDYAQSLQTVAVKTSEVHAIDSDMLIRVPTTRETVAAMTPTAMKSAGDSDASKCLTVDSDGSHWGFRNGCGFAVQFAYCMAGGGDKGSLSACNTAMTSSITGSVAANGFGALTADASLKEKDTAHNFRWIACNGGAGEVVAHLDHFEPPAGRCERTRTASN